MPKVKPHIPDEQVLKELSTLDGEILLLPAQVANVLSISTKQLETNRSEGSPPRFVKVGGVYRYRVADLRAYLQANPVFNNSMEAYHWEVYADKLRFCGIDPLDLRVPVTMPKMPKIKSTKIFFDAAYTSQEDADARVISIGFVAEKGQEFYAELIDGYEPSMCSDFTRDNVLPQLDGGEPRMTLQELGAKLRIWIESLKAKAVLVSDFPPIDWPFIYDLFQASGWPRNLLMHCEPSHFSIPRDGTKYHRAMKDYWLQHADRQCHALENARSLHYAWSSRK